MSRRAPVVALIVSSILVLLLLVLLVMPKFGEARDAEDLLSQAQSEESVLQTELSRLEEVEAKASQLREELARFRRAVPPVADLPGLINQLQTAADVAGVDFFSISPGTPLATGGATEISSQIQVVGGFFPVDEFLFRLETLPRSSKIVTVTVGEGSDGLPQIDVQLDVRFYTTDLQAGPGAAAPTVPATDAASPAPGESPTPLPSPTSGG